MNKSFSVLVISLILFSVLLFGCTALDPNAEKKSLEQFSKLQKSYGVEDSFSPILGTMNDYITDLAVVASSAPAGTKKFIDAELFSASAFYYLNRALDESQLVDYQNLRCSAIEVKSTMELINMASTYQAKAVLAISTLTEGELKNLRLNQLGTVKGFDNQISQIKAFFDEKCFS